MFANLRTLMLAGIVALGLSGAAFAGNFNNYGSNYGGGYDSCQTNHCEPVCQYKWVISYECRTVPYQVCVVKYDHCGRPFKTYITQYRQIQVPVKKLVKYCDNYGGQQLSGNFHGQQFAGGFNGLAP